MALDEDSRNREDSETASTSFPVGSDECPKSALEGDVVGMSSSVRRIRRYGYGGELLLVGGGVGVRGWDCVD